MTPDEIKRLFPNASESTIAANTVGAQEQSALAKPTAGDEPVAAAQAQARDTARYVVRVISHRARLLDEDNLCPKYHVDSCRYAGLLPSDAPGQTEIRTSQVQVSKRDEMTIIEIERL